MTKMPSIPRAIYYLHPLLAGHIEGWPAHFTRIRAMGFTTVLLAPPFLPGRDGNIFLTADHARLNPALGKEDALPALRQIVAKAALCNLEVMLDLVIDRVAVESAAAHRSSRTVSDGPPDPRHPLGDATGILLGLQDKDAHLVDWWQAWISDWLDTGVIGFRCHAAHRVPHRVWSQLIQSTRARHPHAVFMAWTVGATQAQLSPLTGMDFDLAVSSSWAWDFGGDWLNVDTQQTRRIGDVLATAELPFGTRLAANGGDIAARARRALGLATSVGQSWLMPMGFEYAARMKLDAAYGNSADFGIIVATGCDLSRDVTEANRRFTAIGHLEPATLLTAPHASVPVFLRNSINGDAPHAILLNAHLERVSAIDPASVLLPLGLSVANCLTGTMAVPPASTVVLTAGHTSPIKMPVTSKARPATAGTAPRIALEAVTPTVDEGRFPVKTSVGAIVRVEADVICDGHETVAAAMRWKAADEAVWHEIPMRPLGNDRWTASFQLSRVGRYLFNIDAWSDKFGALRSALIKLQDAGRPFQVEQQEAILLMRETGEYRQENALCELAQHIDELPDDEARQSVLLADTTLAMMAAADLRPYHVCLAPDMRIDSERRAAGFSSWYELFPRSQSSAADQHGTFDDVIARLPAIRDMGFDTLYFPPIHPIGRTNRKGRNNSLKAGLDDPGSPYAIGSDEGGHDAIHPELGTIDDFRRLIKAASRHRLDIALDFAIQCSPDHPWLREHPEWFEWRPDGSIKFAENPPKKYEDIVNVDFYAEGARPSLWIALRDIVQFWVNEGVRTFRVDNPHTKPFPFWEWMIGDIRSRHPDVIFLAEAFTRPKVMYRLAKVGFSQSYTYFTWRNTALEMRAYLTELALSPVSEFFRPHFFVNTPDINPEFLHHSGRPGFLLRAALAATLAGLWGVYSGFELCEGTPLGKREEYLDSEKYEIRHWDHDRPGHIRTEITRLNAIRASNPALQTHLGVRFLPCSNDSMLCFVKATPDRRNIIIVAVSFDPIHVQEGELTIAAQDLGEAVAQAFPVRDLFRNRTEQWVLGTRQVRIDPDDQPFFIWRVELEDGQ